MDTDKRLEQLYKAKKELEQHYEILRRRLEEGQIHLAVVDGQIAEREMDKKIPEEGVKLPHYATDEELANAKEERGKSFRGQSVEDIKLEREELYRKEGMGWIDVFAEKEFVSGPEGAQTSSGMRPGGGKSGAGEPEKQESVGD